ncbi:MAG TPA: hypothetical protein PKD29_04960 [Rhodocyclaceae bacterium]|nr:hypothetical protein [Rhodocyclaceae bacterium]
MTRPCDLCGLELGAQPFPADNAGQAWQFCCEDCRGICLMLNPLGHRRAPGDGNSTGEAERSKP